MRSIHAIIFDMDGLVFDSERIAMRALSAPLSILVSR